MPTERDVTTAAVQGRAEMFAAFGLRIEIDPQIDGRRLALASASARNGPAGMPAPAEPPTRIRLDPDELEQLWTQRSATAKRMRELREGESVLLSVDL